MNYIIFSVFENSFYVTPYYKTIPGSKIPGIIMLCYYLLNIIPLHIQPWQVHSFRYHTELP